MQWIQQSIENIQDDVENCPLAYVTYDDICKNFDIETMLAIQGPSDTRLEVPRVENVIIIIVIVIMDVIEA